MIESTMLSTLPQNSTAFDASIRTGLDLQLGKLAFCLGRQILRGAGPGGTMEN